MVRPSFTTEFLLRELLAALGAPMEASAADSLPADSFSEEMSEESESQTPLPAANGRVMMVRRTNSAQHTVTLVDRHFDVEAFIPRHVIGSLQQTRGYNTLGRLRGSVVRVDKYYFATLSRCLSMDEQSSQNSVSRPAITKTSARVYLWVDALSVVDDNELAVNPQPDVYSNVLVKERLQQLTDAELEKVLMAQQSLPAVGGDAEAGGHFGDDRPLMEEDCVISADQEQELEEQEGWGPQATGERQPTDSELIEENGCVSMSQSQVFGETQSQTHRPLPVDLSATLTEPLSQTQCSVSADLSATLSESVDVTPTLDSQKYPFQQENIRETFVIDSGSDTENEEDDEDAEESDEATKKMMLHLPHTRRQSEVKRLVSKAIQPL
ncbi:hypothetical protein PHYBOEH_007564 [Phytophthora boehmeriae]|uniref:Uncharacterized protein n=1 Tax=Phytophthora boehmeriae TaxID=109152 RepID=A0A8T1WBV8_9STRA|nr:hypothetical protein PHYBOEH_007564 [Phytophthora boehmeriae]